MTVEEYAAMLERAYNDSCEHIRTGGLPIGRLSILVEQKEWMRFELQDLGYDLVYNITSSKYQLSREEY